MSRSSDRPAYEDRSVQGLTVGLARLGPAFLAASLVVLALILPRFMFWRGMPEVKEGLGPDA